MSVNSTVVVAAGLAAAATAAYYIITRWNQTSVDATTPEGAQLACQYAAAQQDPYAGYISGAQLASRATTAPPSTHPAASSAAPVDALYARARRNMGGLLVEGGDHLDPLPNCPIVTHGESRIDYGTSMGANKYRDLKLPHTATTLNRPGPHDVDPYLQSMSDSRYAYDDISPHVSLNKVHPGVALPGGDM